MTPQPRYKPGDRIGGRYQVHDVRMGGMGEVYLCLDLEERFPLALKTFQQRYLTAAQHLRDAFEQEAATWIALEKHPNIVRCFAMEILGSQPFIVMEWIAGEDEQSVDLRSWLRRGPLDLKLAMEITIDICRGLIHAQAKCPGLVHRDVKPENILIAQGKLAKITDFGLVQIAQEVNSQLDEVLSITNSRQSIVRIKHIVGTPAYMAPEQWHDESLDERTDIYALGCLLYEMLTGRTPFAVEFTPTTPQQWQMWLQNMQDAHENHSYPKLPAGLTSELDELLQHCLAKKQANRPPNLINLFNQLTALYQRQTNQLPPLRPDPGPLAASDYVNLGITYHALQKYEDAISAYNQSLELDPTIAKTYVSRGAAYYALQKYEQSVVDCDRALALDSKLAQAYANRGLTHFALQNYEQALVDYNRALELHPNDAKAYYNRGHIHVIRRDNQLALADFDYAIQFDPHYAQSYLLRGQIRLALKQYTTALKDLNLAIKLDPNDTRTYLVRGSIYYSLGQHEEALTDYSRAIDLNPTDAQAYFCRANIRQIRQIMQQH